MARGRKPKSAEGEELSGGMEINVFGKYWIRSDELNIIVATPLGTNDAGGTIWKSLSFHQDITGALAWIGEREIRLSPAKTFGEVAEAYKKFNKLLTEISKQIGEVKIG